MVDVIGFVYCVEDCVEFGVYVCCVQCIGVGEWFGECYYFFGWCCECGIVCEI